MGSGLPAQGLRHHRPQLGQDEYSRRKDRVRELGIETGYSGEAGSVWLFVACWAHWQTAGAHKSIQLLFAAG